MVMIEGDRHNKSLSTLEMTDFSDIGTLIVFGVMISYWIDLGFSFLEPSTITWRFPIAFQIVMALIIVIFIPGLPESPRW